MCESCLSRCSRVLLLLTLWTCLGFVRGDNAIQVGLLEAGVDIRIPLNAFQCNAWLVYYSVKPNDYGRNIGIDYGGLALHLTTPDNARRMIVRMGIPSSGEGVLSWQVNLKQGTKFYVAPHGLITFGEVVTVELGYFDAACLGNPTHTQAALVEYNSAVYYSVAQGGQQVVSTRFPNQMTTSPTGMQTTTLPRGVVIAPAAATSSPPPNTDTESQDPGTNTNTDTTSSGDNPTPNLSHEPTSSQSGQTDSSNLLDPSKTASGSDSSIPSETGRPDNGSKGSSSEPGADPQPTGDDPAVGEGSPNKLPAIVGAIVGTVLFLAAAACIFIILRRRRRLRGEPSPFHLLESGSDTRATIGSTGVDHSLLVLPATTEKPSLQPQTRLYDDSHAPSESSRSRESTVAGIPMDLAAALAVVAAHVRSAEGVDPQSAAPPEYSRAARAMSPISSTDPAPSMFSDLGFASSHKT